MNALTARLLAVQNEAAEASTSPTTAPTIVPTSTNWREEYLDVIQNGPWRAVREIGADGKLHDHTPMPPLANLTSIQVGLMAIAERPSKSKKGQKRKPIDPPATHKLCIEIWTVPKEQITRHRDKTQWRRFSTVRVPLAFAKTATNAQAKGHLSTGFRNWALAESQSGGNQGLNDLYGLVHDNNNGWHYYDEHLTAVRMNDPENLRAEIFVNRNLVIQVDLDELDQPIRFDDGNKVTHIGRVDL